MNEPTTYNPLTIFDDPEVKEAFATFTEVLAEALRLTCKIVSATVRLLNSWWAAVKESTIPARWAHLARYARKKRTRAKYQRMIARRWAELLKGVATP